MAVKQITLLLDDERSESEAFLIEYLEGLARNDRQNFMREFLIFSCKLKHDDPVLFGAVAALTNLDGVERDSFTTIGETIARYRNTDQVVKESPPDLKPEPEPKVSEREVEVQLEITEAVPPRKPKGTAYMQ